MNGLIAVILSLCAVSCHGLLWWGRNDETTAIADGRAIDASCLAHAASGSCEFYSCFERRLPCGRDWYMVRHGRYYCDKITQQMPNFNQAGQNFLIEANQCMTQALKPLYQRDFMNCHTLEHDAVENMAQCFRDHAFCSVLRSNSGAFSNIYEIRDLFSPGANKIWRMFTSLSFRCGAQYLRDGLAETHSSVIDGVNEAVDTISDAIRDSSAIDRVNEAVGTISEAIQDSGALDHVNKAVNTIHEAVQDARD